MKTLPKKEIVEERKRILSEFEEKSIYRMPKREAGLVLLALRVRPDTKRRLSELAERRGISGHTTMARLLLEEAITAPEVSPHERKVVGLAANRFKDEAAHAFAQVFQKLGRGVGKPSKAPSHQSKRAAR